jgi:hypothetical protein
MRYLRQSTAVDVPVGPFVDSTDGFTAETALGLVQADVRLKKGTNAWAQKTSATAPVHEENGYYEVALDTTDTGTLGHLRLAVNKTGALPVWEDFMVMPANVWDSLFGTDILQVDAREINGALLNGNNADVSLRSLNITNSVGTALTCASTGGNGHGLSASGNGTGAGLRAVAGATGAGITATGGATSGNGATVSAPTNGTGLAIASQGASKPGLSVYGNGAIARGIEVYGSGAGMDVYGDTGPGAKFYAGDGSTGGSGLEVSGSGNKSGLHVSGGPTDGHGIEAICFGTGQAVFSADFLVTVVSDAGNSATSFKTDRTETANDHWKGCYLTATSGALIGQTRKVTGYNGTTKIVTVDAFTATPSVGDTFNIINE